MTEESGEKKYKPTARRLEQLRKEGDFLRAREFYSGLTLVSSLLVLFFIIEQLYSKLANNFTSIYSNLHILIRDDDAVWQLFKSLALNNLLMLVPIFVGFIIVFLLLVHSFGGLGFSTSLLRFKGERLNPVSNIGRLFSLKNLIDTLKSIMKIVLFFAILAIFIHGHQLEIISLEKIDSLDLIQRTFLLLKEYLLNIIFGIILIAVVDALINYFQYHKKTMMSYQELKDDSKEAEGNPEIKRKIRQAQHAVSLRRLQQDMPTASVVITNPTHYAVALRYTDQVDSAPKIIAKGVDHMAKNIRILAVKHAIPIYEAPELARAIYHSGKVGNSIHPELYMAVAIVLSYILQMKNYQLGLGQAPQKVDDLQIPAEFKFK